ncbi:MAG: 2-oxoacid:ferredoxin oxidoreductase subunit beta [Gemmatimonadales bacterium]
MTTIDTNKPSAKDFASDQEVRWCPGCGDYAILKAVQRTMPSLGVPKERTVFVSGIGCAARFPYYMSTYGFHTIHGRAPAFATGIKLANPDLSVWIVSGDGDSLSIGGNHLIHLLRRNLDVQLLLFNNEIYGLTKGQYSPTSRRGTVSPSTPKGSVENPMSAAQLALGAGARFVARAIDTHKGLPDVLRRAHEHRGMSLVEIFQNCVVFNDGVFSHFTERSVAPDTQLWLEHGKPMLFGSASDKGLRIKPGALELEAVTVGADGITADDVLVHDETNRSLALLLAQMEPPDLPVAAGVIYCNPGASYERSMREQMPSAASNDLDTLFTRGQTWVAA